MSKKHRQKEKASKPPLAHHISEQENKSQLFCCFFQKAELWSCGKVTRSVAKSGILLLHDTEVYIYLLIRMNLVAEDKIFRTHQEISIFLV